MCRSVVLHQVQIVPRTTAQRSVPITLADTKMSSDDFGEIIRHGPLALLATRQQVGVWMDR